MENIAIKRYWKSISKKRKKKVNLFDEELTIFQEPSLNLALQKKCFGPL